MESYNTKAHLDRVRALDERWTRASDERDLDSMLSIYAEDARELLPGIEPIEGRDAIRAFYAGIIHNYPRYRHRFTPEEVTIAGAGDLAVIRGTYEFTPDFDEPDEVQRGKYVSVWRNEGDDWKLVLNISNETD